MLSFAARLLVVAVLGLASAGVAHAQLESPLDSDDSRIEKLPLRGSYLDFLQTVAAHSFLKGSQQSFNPTYNWGFTLNLAWHFNDRLSLSLNQGLELELTDSDTTLERQRPMLTDTRLTFDAGLYEQKLSSSAAWALHGSVALLAPTSLASQAATMVLGSRVGLAAGLSLPKVLDGMAIDVGLGYLHRFLRSNVAEPEEPYPCFAGRSSTELCNQLGGSTNTRSSIRTGVAAQLAFNDKWGAYLSAVHVWSRGADLADVTFVSSTGATEKLQSGDVRHWRNSNILELGASYAVLSWLGLGVAMSNTFDERGPNGEFREPLNPVDTYFGLNAQLKLDDLYLLASGGRPPKRSESPLH